MTAPPPSPGEKEHADLCGVRLVRGGPVQFIAALGHRLPPDQLVVITTTDGELLATVAIGSGQVIENQAGVAPVGQVVRIAKPDDALTFGRRAAEEAAIAARCRKRCIEAGGEILDTWLAQDGARAVIVLTSAVPGVNALARDLTASLGIEVSIRVRTDHGEGQALSGIAGAGLPPEWAERLVPPGGAPVLRRAADEAGPPAGEFIARLFPLAEGWPPPRPPRRRQP